MVKILEAKTSDFIDLKEFKKDIQNYESINHRDYEKIYMCDCDSFGGGSPPCDCNR